MAVATPQRKQATEHDRAVATKHDRELTRIEHLAHCVCESDRIVGDTPRIQQQRFRVTAIVVGRRFDATRAPRAQALGQACRQQGVGQCLNTLREQSEHRRGFDDGEPRTGHVWLLLRLQGRTRSGFCACPNRSLRVVPYCRAATRLASFSNMGKTLDTLTGALSALPFEKGLGASPDFLKAKVFLVRRYVPLMSIRVFETTHAVSIEFVLYWP